MDRPHAVKTNKQHNPTSTVITVLELPSKKGGEEDQRATGEDHVNINSVPLQLEVTWYKIQNIGE